MSSRETISVFSKKIKDNPSTAVDSAATVNVPVSAQMHTSVFAFTGNNENIHQETPHQQMSIPVIFINGNNTDINMEGIINALSATFKSSVHSLSSYDPSVKDTGKNASGPILRIVDIELNTENYTAKRGGINLNLQLRQFKLLQYMMQNRDRLLSETELINNVWDDSSGGLKSKVLSACISKLRASIDKNADKKLIHTRYSLGYIFSDNL
jgi:DNA-binding response OmpR family regulator